MTRMFIEKFCSVWGLSREEVNFSYFAFQRFTLLEPEYLICKWKLMGHTKWCWLRLCSKMIVCASKVYAISGCFGIVHMISSLWPPHLPSINTGGGWGVYIGITSSICPSFYPWWCIMHKNGFTIFQFQGHREGLWLFLLCLLNC